MPAPLALTGQRFGHLTALDRAGKDQRIRVYKDRESRWWCTALADGYVVCSRTWREAYETALEPRRWWMW